MPLPLLIPLIAEGVSLSAGAITAIVTGSALVGGSIAGGIVYWLSSDEHLKERYTNYIKMLESTKDVFATEQQSKQVKHIVDDMNRVFQKELFVNEQKHFIEQLPKLQKMLKKHSSCVQKEQNLSRIMKLIPTDFSMWNEKIAERSEHLMQRNLKLKQEIIVVSSVTFR